MVRKPVCVALSAAVALGGCATSAQDVSPTYVSPLQYQAHDCDQLAAEAQRVQSRVITLGGHLDRAADNDKAIVGVGLILFWPVLFAIGGTKAQEAEYSRLKGEYDALEQATIAKKCSAVSTGRSFAVDQAGQKTLSGEASAPVALSFAQFEIVDQFTNSRRTVEVGARDISKGALPGTGDFSDMMPPGGWVPADAESIGQCTRRYEARDGASRSKVDVSAKAEPRIAMNTPLGLHSVLPVTYTGWMKRNVGYGDMMIEHRATFRIWHSLELGIPIKFESKIEATGNYIRPSKESLRLVSID